MLPLAALAFAAVASAQIYPYAGTGTAGSAGIGGDPLSLQLNTPIGIASNSQANAYIADYGNNRVVSVSGTASLYAGNGLASSSGDGGPASLASLNGPFGVVTDENQNLYISEYSGGRIRKVDFSTQTITTIAGNGSGLSGGDGGAATNAGLVNPAGLAYASGILYVVEYGRSIRQINLSTGIITTLVDTSSGLLSIPMWVTVETFPNGVQRVLVTDVGLHKILSVDPNTAAISVFAGNGDPIYEGDGMLAVNTGMGSGALSVYDDQNGGLYAADANLNRIRRIDRDTGIIETVGGNGFDQPLTPNTASGNTSTALQSPRFAMANYSGGYILFSDSNNRVWRLMLPYPSSHPYTATTAAVSPVSPDAGQNMSLTATVAPIGISATPTGSVTFEDANFNLIGTATLSGGSATLSTTAPPSAGSYSIYAVYSGDYSFFSSTSAALVIAVHSKDPSATALSSAPNPSIYGQPVTLTATVTPSTATGTVQFLDGTIVLGTTPVTGGTAALATAALTAGSHSITAVYGGDGSHTGSTSAAVMETVNPISTSTTLTSSANPSTFGQPVTFTATIAPGATGSVQFFDGNTPLGTVAVSSGTAALTTSSLPAGYQSIAASYSGDANYTGSIGYVNQSVTKPTTTSLTSDKTSITYGQAVTFTATVSPATVSGTVQFMNGTVSIGTAVLSSGQAKLSTVSLTGGTDSVTAVYSGDATDGPSTSAPRIITVSRAKPAVNLASSQNPIAVGQAVTFTAGINAAVATGTVTFKDGSRALGTVTLDMSTAAFSTSALASGNHSITAVYSGDGNYTQATSSPLMERVK